MCMQGRQRFAIQARSRLTDVLRQAYFCRTRSVASAKASACRVVNALHSKPDHARPMFYGKPTSAGLRVLLVPKQVHCPCKDNPAWARCPAPQHMINSACRPGLMCVCSAQSKGSGRTRNLAGVHNGQERGVCGHAQRAPVLAPRKPSRRVLHLPAARHPAVQHALHLPAQKHSGLLDSRRVLHLPAARHPAVQHALHLPAQKHSGLLDSRRVLHLPAARHPAVQHALQLPAQKP